VKENQVSPSRTLLDRAFELAIYWPATESSTIVGSSYLLMLIPVNQVRLWHWAGADQVSGYCSADDVDK
jgi:hypothetical protein